MIGFIGSERSSSVLSRIRDSVVSAKVGNFDGQTFLALCQQFSSLNIQILFLDVGCSDDDAIFKGVRIIRVHRDSTRIVAITSGRQPGDPLMSSLVSLGVYDILNLDDFSGSDELSEELNNILLRQPKYSNAARWHFSIDESSFTKEETRRVQNQHQHHHPVPPILDDLLVEPPPPRAAQVIERLIGTATIAVAGVTRRTGATHLSISLSSFLSSRNLDVACLEMNDHPVFRFIAESDPAKINKGFRRGADFYPMVDDSLMDSVFSYRYQVVVLDLGEVVQSRLSEIGRANAVFLTMGSSEWDFQHLIRTLDVLHESGFGHDFCVVVNFADPETFREIEQSLNKKDRERLRIRFFRNPLSADPFHVSDELRTVFEEFLPFLPKRNRFKFF